MGKTPARYLYYKDVNRPRYECGEVVCLAVSRRFRRLAAPAGARADLEAPAPVVTRVLFRKPICAGMTMCASRRARRESRSAKTRWEHLRPLGGK